MTMRGGQGNDAITSAAGNFLAGNPVNGNKDADTITLINSTQSTVYGGQGADTFTLTAAGTISNSIVNGNKDNDTINATGGVGAAAAFAASSVYGGQGIDSINASAGATGGIISGGVDADTITAGGNLAGSTVNGNGGNDTITYLNAGSVDFVAGIAVRGKLETASLQTALTLRLLCLVTTATTA